MHALALAALTACCLFANPADAQAKTLLERLLRQIVVPYGI